MIKAKVLCLALLFFCCIFLAGQQGSAAEVATANGVLTGGIQWELSSAGTLKFYGTGSFPAFQEGKVPWASYVDKILKVEFVMKEVPSGSLDYYFEKCNNLTQVGMLPEGITSMKRTFYQCKVLRSVVIVPSTVEQAREAFRGCKGLQTAPVFSESGKLKNIDYCFAESNLSYGPAIPNGVTSMEGAFMDCASLQISPNLPGGVTNMRNCFKNCARITEIENLPKSVKDIGYCFYGCSGVRKLPEMGNYVENMEYAFWGCKSAVSMSHIPASVKKMSYAMVGCVKLSGDVMIYAVINNPENYRCFAGDSLIYDDSTKANFMGAQGTGLVIHGVFDNEYMINSYLTYGWNSGGLQQYGVMGKLSIGNRRRTNMALTEISAIADYVYTGKAICPEVKIYYRDHILELDSDYRVVYSNNINVGTGHIEIVGIGNYTGSTVVDFKINLATLKPSTVKKYEGTYDGKVHSISVESEAGTTIRYGTTEGQYLYDISPAYSMPGEYVVYYKVSKLNYVSRVGSSKVIIHPANLSVSVKGYEGTYDGKEHGLTVSGLNDAQIRYRLGEQGAYEITKAPTFRNPGTYVIYYEIAKLGYNTVYGSSVVHIIEEVKPTIAPTLEPTQSPTLPPTEEPTQAPTEEPTEAPTLEPTQSPTLPPTEEPTQAPTLEPTLPPTLEPTQVPTQVPTESPIVMAPEGVQKPEIKDVQDEILQFENPGESLDNQNEAEEKIQTQTQYEQSKETIREIVDRITSQTTTIVELPKITKIAVQNKKTNKVLIRLKWKKCKKAKGYQVKWYSDKKLKKRKGTAYTRGNQIQIRWKKGKKCYVRVRGYVLVNGKRIYGRWSKVYIAKK